MLLSDFSIKRPIPTVVIIIMLMVLGMMALNKLRVNQIPDVEQPVLVVNIPYPGASPETVEREIISERARRAARFVGAAPEWLDQTLTEEKKKCPRCAELIKAEASFCRFCQYDLTGKPPVPASR